MRKCTLLGNSAQDFGNKETPVHGFVATRKVEERKAQPQGFGTYSFSLMRPRTLEGDEETRRDETPHTHVRVSDACIVPCTRSA